MSSSQELTFEDAVEWLGNEQAMFHRRLEKKQRIGQAWMNSLPMEEYTALTNSPFDPFYMSSKESVVRALEYLLTR